MHDTPFAGAGGGGGAGFAGSALGGSGFGGTGFFAGATFCGASFFAGATFCGASFFAGNTFCGAGFAGNALCGAGFAGDTVEGAAFAGAAASFTGSGFWAVCTGAPRFNWPRWMGAGAANIQLDTTSHSTEKQNLTKADFCIAWLVSHNQRHETSRNYWEIKKEAGGALLSRGRVPQYPRRRGP